MVSVAATEVDANRAGDRARRRVAHAGRGGGGGAARAGRRACARGTRTQRGRAPRDRADARARAALYGATTGVGALRDRTISDSNRERFQWNLLRSHAVSAGRPLAPELVRAGMVTRANQLGAGGAGVTPALLDALARPQRRRDAAHARVRLARHGRSSGLAEIALALLGEGKVWRDGELVDAPAPARGP